MTKTTTAYIAETPAQPQTDNAGSDTEFSAKARVELVEFYRAAAVRAIAQGWHGTAWRWECAARALE
jgi:hypothetical protein